MKSSSLSLSSLFYRLEGDLGKAEIPKMELARTTGRKDD